MNNNNDEIFNNGNESQFIISYELLTLLHWMIEHDTDALKKIVSRALKTGLKKELLAKGNKTQQLPYSSDEMHNSIIDFFDFLEATLFDSLSNQAMQKVLDDNLIPAIGKIDTHECDQETVRASIEQATNNIEMRPNETIKELLYEEILRQWEPNHKKIQH